MSADMYLIPGAIPAQLSVMEPAAAPDLPVEAALSAYSGACTRCMLDICSDIYSKWFLVMKGAICRERARQQQYREDNNLPKCAKVDYVRPVMGKDDIVTSRSCETTIRHVFGDAAANYARERFYNAIATGDMRSFKLRLLVLRTRDSIASKLMRDIFSEGVESCISKAESLAGCIACPGPRRLSHKEQERRMSRLASQSPDADMSSDNAPLQDIEHTEAGGLDSQPPDAEHYSTDCKSNVDNEKSSHLESGTINDETQNKTKVSCGTVTNQKKENSGTVQVSVGLDADSLPHKVRPYATLQDILNDISSGKIRPYEDEDEIISDLKKGLLTPGEAFLFTGELEMRKPQSGRKKRKQTKKVREEDLAELADEIIAREVGDGEDFDMGDSDLPDDDYDEDRNEDRDEDAADGDEEENIDDGYRRDSRAGYDGAAYRTGRYRYSACFGGYNSSGSEWCPDDDC